MVGLIARRELSLLLRDGRLVIAALAILIGMLAAGVSGWTQFSQAERERAHFIAEARDQWLNQGERHPHRAAHFGVYVAKPETALALFEPGLRPFAGQTLWLEAHDRPAYSNVPSEDDVTLSTGLGVASGSAILQILGGLLGLCLASLAIVRERETGVLRQILAQGVAPRALAAGKFLGLSTAILGPLVVGAALLVVLAVAAAPSGDRLDVALRALALISADVLLIGALIAVGLAISAVARSSRAALLTALALWVSCFVLAPRLAATLCERFAPAPSLEAYRKASSDTFAKGFDARGGYSEQLKALEAQTMKRYGVERLSDLPVGFSGIRMQHMDAWTIEVDEREYARLAAAYERQANIRLALATVAPFIAARSVSQGMAGMDWAHYRDFLDTAETYRRRLGLQMNTVLERGVRGERWEMDGDRTTWSTVAPFEYQMPRVRWALERQAGFAAILLLWTMLGGAALALAARRLRP